MTSRVLETVLTGRNLLSPVLAAAGRDVVAFNSTVAGANEKAAVGAAASAKAQQAAAGSSAAASGKAAGAAATGAVTQSTAADKIAASNVKASTSASASSQQQMRAHSQAAQSATLAARTQESANRALAGSNALLGASLTPLTAGLGATALGLGYAAFKGMDFDKSMSAVAAASQETGATLDRMRQAALDAGADTQYSATEAAAGITELSKAGVGAADVLGGGLTGALNLAAAGQMEVADAAEVGATALSVFNLKGDQMSHVADLLAAGAGKAQGSVHDLGMALNQSALVANQAGLSIEDTTGALAMFAYNGLVGSDAGTSFKTMLQALTPNSEKAATAMADMGLSAFDAGGNFIGLEAFAGKLQTALAGMTEEQRNSTLETIFGSDAVRAASVLYKEGAAGVAEWTAKVNDAGFAQRQAAQLTDNLAGDLERLGGSVDTFFTNLGDGAQGPLREAVQMLTMLVNAGGEVLGFFTSLPGPVQAALVGFAALAAFHGPLAAFFTMLQVKAVLGTSALLEMALSADGLRNSLAGLALAAVAWSVGKAIDEIVTFTQAGDDAQAMIDSFADSLGDLEGRARIDANAAAIRQLRNELQDYQKIVDASENQNWFDEWIWDNPFGDENEGLRDARESIKLIEAEMGRLRGSSLDAADAIDEAGTSISGLPPTVESAYASVEGYAAMLGLGTEATEDLRVKTEELGESLGAFVDPLGAYTGLLEEKKAADRKAAEAQAADTESMKDSWEDYVTSVDVSLDEYMARLEQQMVDQQNWQLNMLLLAGRVSQGTLDELARMGPEGAPLVADLVNASDAELDRFDEITAARSKEATDAWGEQLRLAQPVLAEIGKTAGQGVVNELAAQLLAGTTTVAAIAAQYGIELANGINPILVSLGKGRIRIDGRPAQGHYLEAAGGVMDFYAAGGLREDHVAQIAPAGAWRVWAEPETGGEGYVPLANDWRRPRALNVWREIGKRIDAPEAQHFAFGGISDVPRPPSTAPYQAPISTAADATMQKGFDEVRTWLAANLEPASGGSASGLLPIMTAARQYVMDTYGVRNIGGFARRNIAGTNVLSDHALGKAIDVMTSNRPLGWAIANDFAFGAAHDRFRAENVIWQQSISSRGGAFKRMADRGSPTQNHYDHVHVDTYDTGGMVPPGINMLGNFTGGAEHMGILTDAQWATLRDLATPAAMPGYGMGGGWGGSVPSRPIVVSLAGATVTGRFEFGSDGLVTLVDGRIDGALGQITDTMHYAGG